MPTRLHGQRVCVPVRVVESRPSGGRKAVPSTSRLDSGRSTLCVLTRDMPVLAQVPSPKTTFSPRLAELLVLHMPTRLHGQRVCVPVRVVESRPSGGMFTAGTLSTSRLDSGRSTLCVLTRDMPVLAQVPSEWRCIRSALERQATER
jgi:hypothetical protein